MTHDVSSSMLDRVSGLRVTQADLAYRMLRHAVVTWRVEPGAWLAESDLQELTGRGRTPTREGAARLVDEELLFLIPRNGYQVRGVSVDEAAALYDVFEALSPVLARLAAGRVDQVSLNSLRGVAEATSLPPVDELVARTEQLFESIHQAAGNPWLRQANKSLFNHLERLWVLNFTSGDPVQILASFSEMLGALEPATSPESAEAGFAKFTDRTRRLTLQTVSQYTFQRAVSAQGHLPPEAP